MTTIRKATATDLDQINEFYRSVNYSPGAENKDLILIAELGQALIGVVRLCEENGETVLRGMQIHPEHQKSGVGTKLLHELEPLISDKPCWCIPYNYLENFYGKIGFNTVPSASSPKFLQERLSGYQERGFEVICMARK